MLTAALRCGMRKLVEVLLALIVEFCRESTALDCNNSFDGSFGGVRALPLGFSTSEGEPPFLTDRVFIQFTRD